MTILRVSMAIVLVAFAAVSARAQNAVQLPTYSSFGTGTTISVPDRGSVYTGGINRAYDGRNEFGAPLLPFGNRSIGSERSATSVWTSAYIHDFAAMDEALLNQARGSGYRSNLDRSAGTAWGPRVDNGPLPPVSKPWQVSSRPRPTTGPASMSVEQLRARREQELQVRATDAERLFERGKSAQAKGKIDVAKIYYRQASRRADGPLQEEILAQLKLITESSVAQR